MTDDLTSQRIAHFRVDGKVGEGGMGVVYRATDDKLGRTVALKVLPEGFADDDGRRKRFLREARAAAGITHPNVVTIYEIGESNGRIFIAMELAAGEPLRAWLGRGTPSLSDALRVARGIARALARAHESGIVHRDLKPDNVIVGPDLEPKVLDFGLAKPFDLDAGPTDRAIGDDPTAAQLTLEGHVVGSPGYMSPEQAAGRPTDPRTDVFSFGVVLYEMTTGRRPFRGDSVMEVLVATTRDDPAPPRALRPEISERLERVIRRCLEKKAEARYADLGEVLRDLDEPDAGSAVDPLSKTVAAPIAAVGVTAPAPLVPSQQGVAITSAMLGGSIPSPKRRAPWIVAAVAVAALGAAGFGLLRAYGRGDDPRAAARAIGGAASATATAVTDQPLPRSSSAEAIAEYRAGMQALRDDSFGQARAHFLRAAELDDSLALAHLRVAMTLAFSGVPGERRAQFSKAVAFRDQLGARDQALLEALEPALGFAQEDRKEAFSRLSKLGERYPLDVEIFDWMAMLSPTTEGALAAADRAIALDGKDAQALEMRGRALETLGRTVEAREALERCSATSLGTADGYLWLSEIDSSEGRCEDSERELRLGLDRDPGFIRLLPPVLVGAGRRQESVRETMKLAGARLPEGARQKADATNEADLSMLAGDFVRAKKAAADYAALVEADPNAPYEIHLAAADLGTSVARETGDSAAAFEIATSFALRSGSWSSFDGSNRGINDTMRILRLAVGPGGISTVELEKLRATWIEERRRASGAAPALVWAYGYAAGVETREEAVAALAVLPQYQPLVWFPTRAGLPEAEIGRTYLLAGDADEAAKYLARAVHYCNAKLLWPIEQTRAAFDLGRAHEERHDTAAACSAYGEVLERWGHANPRSVTADKARARRKALACAEGGSRGSRADGVQ